jgi:methyl-accepting chemotaxis protein
MSDIAEALESVARELKYLGNGNAGGTMGAIEFHAKTTGDAMDRIADAIQLHGSNINSGLTSVANAIEHLAEAINDVRLDGIGVKVKP